MIRKNVSCESVASAVYQDFYVVIAEVQPFEFRQLGHRFR